MAERLLSDRACKTARTRQAVYYLNDGNRLRLQVRPDGAKYWMFRYTLGGRESTYSLGVYPDVSLEAARKGAAEARALVRTGVRPSVARKVRRAQNIVRGEATFEAVAREWLARQQPHWSGVHHERNEGLLRRILFPTLGSLPVADITEPMLLKPLQHAYDNGVRESARRARAVAQQVFAYAKDTHRITYNPARELAGSSVLKKPAVTHFAALPKGQVGSLLRKLEAGRLDLVTSAALHMMLYTGLRDHSLRAARWNEIDFARATWTIPASRMKSGREHRVPLPRQAVAVLKGLANLTRTGANSSVFASRGRTGFLAENTLRLALHRLGFKVTAHGFRSLLTDVLNERGFNADAIERQLDHVNKNQVRSSYLRTDFLDYRRPMMQWLANWAEAKKLRRAEPAFPRGLHTP